MPRAHAPTATTATKDPIQQARQVNVTVYAPLLCVSQERTIVESEQHQRVIAIPLFDGLTVLDAVGPYEVLARLPHTKVEIVGPDRLPVGDCAGLMKLVPSSTFDEVPTPDILVVPGGEGVDAACRDEVLLSWLRRAHESSEITASVCTGALLLGAASVLQGRRATTHWLAADQLAAFGATPVDERVVIDGDIVTSAGVSAGIDMALVLASRLAGEATAQAIQLSLEYAPEPPFSAGTPKTAPPEITSLVTALAARRTTTPSSS